MLLRFLHSPDDGQPEGGESGDVKASDIINRYGNTAESALRLAEKVADLENRLYRLRRTRDALTSERDDLKAKLPADGAVVVAEADANALEAYKALGEPAALKQALDARQAAEAKLSALTRQEAIRAAAEASGFKPSVLATLAGSLEIQTKPSEDGTPVAVVVADGTETPLAAYAEKAWADFLPALKPQAAQPIAPDINGGARSATGPAITDQDRERARARYQATF